MPSCDAMNPWLTDLATLWRGGPIEECVAGHGLPHATRVVDSIEHDKIEVFDWQQYEGSDGYCPADDVVSKSIGFYRVWEASGTRLVRDRLAERVPGPDVVLDFGSHIGWYSLLAARYGYDVLAVGADPEHYELLGRNADRCSVRDRIEPCLGWVGPDKPVMPFPDDPELRVRVLKADVEGAEDQVVRMCWPMIETRRVDCLLVEISPVFHDRYPDLVVTVADCGYDVAVVPRADDSLERIPYPALRHYTASIAQRDFLFTRQP